MQDTTKFSATESIARIVAHKRTQPDGGADQFAHPDRNAARASRSLDELKAIVNSFMINTLLSPSEHEALMEYRSARADAQRAHLNKWIQSRWIPARYFDGWEREYQHPRERTS